jgi:hypothetical protein
MPPSVARNSEWGPALQQDLQAQQESKSNEVRVSLLVDEDTVPWGIFPTRKFARKPCTSACERPPVSSLTFGKVFPAADVASKSRRPRSRSRPHNRGDRTFRKPLRPEPVIAQGQGRVDCCSRMQREHPNPRRHPQGQQDRGQACPLLRCARSSPVLRFPCIRPYATRGNEEGSCFLEKRPEQEDTPSSPLSSMELKFELDTRLTASCVVAVASAYSLVTVSIAIDSVLLVFGNTVILLLILFVLFGWRELLGELNKKRSTAN